MRQFLPLTLAGLLGFTSCNSNEVDAFSEHRVANQHEAGSIHFAVISVAPWQYYADALQPQFQLTESQALAEVVPATRAIEETMLEVAKASAGVAYDDENGNAGINPETLDTTIINQKPIGTSSAQGLPDFEVSLDPMTRYWAATSFFQEVQLLSRYVQDAAVRDGFRPYLVRLQITLLPAARNEPYDAYITLSFFSDDGDIEPMEIRSPYKQEITSDGSKRRIALPSTSTTVARERASAQVLPLMVTDNLEASIQSSVMQSVKQIAAAINIVSGNAGGGAGIENLDSDLEQVLGSDLNSLLTVARVSDNTLRVRLGAMQQGTANYAMVPRNHNITLLLMIPEDAGEIVQVVAKSTLVDAETGRELPDRDPGEVDEAIEQVLDSHELYDVDARALRPLVVSAQSNDQRTFDREFARLFADDPSFAGYKNVLWLDLISLMIGSRYSATEFDLPVYDPESERGTSVLPPQTAHILPGPGETAVVTLSSSNRVVDPTNWSAALEVQRPGQDVILVPSNGVFVDPLSGQVQCFFPPSYGYLGRNDPGGTITLVVSDQNNERRFGAAWRR